MQETFIIILIIFGFFLIAPFSLFYQDGEGKTFFYIRPIVYAIIKKKKLYFFSKIKYSNKTNSIAIYRRS